MSDKRKQLVTSIRVDVSIWKEIKVEARKQDITLTKAVEEAIKCWINRQAIKQKK